MLRDYDLDHVRQGGVLRIKPREAPEREATVSRTYRPLHRSASYLSGLIARSHPDCQRIRYGSDGTGQASGYLYPSGASMVSGGQAGANMLSYQQGGAGRVPVYPGQTGSGSVPVAQRSGNTAPDDLVVYACAESLAEQVSELLAAVDVPSGEVVIKAAVYEVGTNRDEGSALQLALAVSGLTVQAGAAITGPTASIKLSAGGLDVLASALDADTRFRSVSRPHVRVTSGAEARFSVGADVPVLGQAQLDRNGNPVQAIDYRSSGVILTVRPDVRQEVVELQVSQELSSFVVTQTGVNGSPTLQKRSVSSRLTLRPGEVVALAGLQDDTASDKESRVPLLGWMLGETKTQRKSEVLVFIEAQRL